MTVRLQDEIKQTKPFASKTGEALLSIMRTASVLEHGMNEALRPFGLTTTQYNVLRILRGAGARGLCGREISERLVSSVPDVSRLLERMTDAGLIAKQRDATDRRHVTASITAKGKRAVVRATPALDAFSAERAELLTNRSATLLLEALASIREGE